MLSDVGSIKFSSYKDYRQAPPVTSLQAKQWGEPQENYETWKNPKHFVGVPPIASFSPHGEKKIRPKVKQQAEPESQNTTKSDREHRSRLNLPRGYASYLQACKQSIHGFHGYNNGTDQAHSKSQKIRYWEKKTPIALNNVASLKVKRQIKPLTKSRFQKSVTITSIGSHSIDSTLPLHVGEQAKPKKKQQTESEPLNVVSDYLYNSDSNQISDSGPAYRFPTSEVHFTLGGTPTYTAYICAKGPTVIYAKNIKLPKGLKCVDPDKYIVTLADDGLFYLRFALTGQAPPVVTPQAKYISHASPPKNIVNGVMVEEGIESLQVTKKTNIISPTSASASINQGPTTPKVHPMASFSPWEGKVYCKREEKEIRPGVGLQAEPEFLNVGRINRTENEINHVSSLPKPLYNNPHHRNKILAPLGNVSKNRGYTKDLIEKQYLLYTNDTIKQRNFQTPSIIAQIQKTCLLNIQIKHYYYKCGRFDRFLFDLIKPFKPYIKSNSYNERNLNKGYIYLSADKTRKSFAYDTYCLKNNKRRKKRHFVIPWKSFSGSPVQEKQNSKTNFTLRWDPIQSNKSENIRFVSLKQSVKKEYFLYFCNFLKPHSSISKNSQKIVSFIINQRLQLCYTNKFVFPQLWHSKLHSTDLFLSGSACRFTPGLISFSPWGEKKAMGWNLGGEGSYGFTLSGNLKQSNLLNYQLPCIALENIKFINDLSIILLVPDKSVAYKLLPHRPLPYKKKNSSSNSFAKRWLKINFSSSAWCKMNFTPGEIHFTALSHKPELAIKGDRLPFTMVDGQRLPGWEGKVYCMQRDPNTFNYLLSPNSQQIYAYYNMLRDTRIEWQFGTSTRYITKQPIIRPWQTLSGIKCILLQTMRWGSKQLQSLIINAYLKLESLPKAYTENERLEQRNDNDIRSFYSLKTRINIKEKKDLFGDVCLFSRNKLLDNFILFSSRIPTCRNNIKWIPDSLSLRSLSKFYFLKEWEAFFSINLNIINKSQTTIKPIPNNSVVLKPIYLNVEQIFYILKQSAKFRKNQRINPSFFDLTHRFRFLSSLTRAYHNGLNMLTIKTWSGSTCRFTPSLSSFSPWGEKETIGWNQKSEITKRNSAIIAKKNSLSPKGFLVFQKNNYASKNLLGLNVTKPYFGKKNKKWSFLSTQQNREYLGFTPRLTFSPHGEKGMNYSCTPYLFSMGRKDKEREKKEMGVNTESQEAIQNDGLRKKNSRLKFSLSSSTLHHFLLLGKSETYYYKIVFLVPNKLLLWPWRHFISPFLSVCRLFFFSACGLMFCRFSFFSAWGKRKDGKSTKTPYNNQFTTKYFDKISNLSLNFKINHNSLQVEPFTINIYNSKIAYTLRYLYPFKYTIFETFLQFLFKCGMEPSLYNSPSHDGRGRSIVSARGPAGSISSHKILKASPANLTFEKQKSKFDLIQYNESFKMYTNLACAQPYFGAKSWHNRSRENKRLNIKNKSQAENIGLLSPSKFHPNPSFSPHKEKELRPGVKRQAEPDHNIMVKNAFVPFFNEVQSVHTETFVDQKQKRNVTSPIVPLQTNIRGVMDGEGEQQEEKVFPLTDKDSAYSSHGLSGDKKHQMRPMKISSFNPELNLMSKGAYPAFITPSGFSFSKSNTWFDSWFDYFSERFQASQKKRDTAPPHPLGEKAKFILHASPPKGIVNGVMVGKSTVFTMKGVRLPSTYFFNDSCHATFFPNPISSVDLCKQPSRITQKQVTAEFLPQLKDRFFLQTNYISSSWFHSEACPTYIQSILPSTFTLERRDYFYSQRFYFQHGNVYNQLSFLPVKKKAYTMAGIGNNLTWSAWNLVCMGQSLNSSFSFLLDNKKKVRSNPASQGFFSKVNGISTYLPLLEDTLPKHTRDGFFNLTFSPHRLDPWGGKKKSRVGEGRKILNRQSLERNKPFFFNRATTKHLQVPSPSRPKSHPIVSPRVEFTIHQAEPEEETKWVKRWGATQEGTITDMQKYDSTLCFSLSFPIISLLISCSACYFRLFRSPQNNQILLGTPDQKRPNNKAHFIMGWEQKKKIKPTIIKHLHHVSRISSELSNNDDTSFTCKWRIMNILNFTDAFITIPYTESFYLQPLHSNYKNAIINNYKNVLRTNRKMKKNSGSAWCKMNFTPGKVHFTRLPGWEGKVYCKPWNGREGHRVANETRPPESLPFTMGRDSRSAFTMMGGEGILYAVGPKWKKPFGSHPIALLFPMGGEGILYTVGGAKPEISARTKRHEFSNRQLLENPAEKQNLYTKNVSRSKKLPINRVWLYSYFSGEYWRGEGSAWRYLRNEKQSKMNLTPGEIHFTLGLDDRKRQKKKEVSLKSKPMNSQETFDSLHQRFERQIANHFQKFPVSKNLAISFENIYYKNVLWNSRKITLRLLTNAILPLIANRKFSVITSIPLKNSIVPIYTKTSDISRVGLHRLQYTFPSHHGRRVKCTLLGVKGQAEPSFLQYSPDRERQSSFDTELGLGRKRYASEPHYNGVPSTYTDVFGLNINSKVPRYYTFFGTEPFPFSCYKFSFLPLKTVNPNFYPDSSIYAKGGVQRVRKKCLSSFGIINESFRVDSNLKSNTEELTYKTNTLNPREMLMVRDSALSIIDLWFSSFFCMYSLYGISTKSDLFLQNLINIKDWTSNKEDSENNNLHLQADPENHKKIHLSSTPSLGLAFPPMGERQSQHQTPSFHKKGIDLKISASTDFYDLKKKIRNKPQGTTKEKKLNNKSKNCAFPYQFSPSHRLKWNDKRGLPLFNNESLSLTHSSNYHWRKIAHFVFVRNYKKKDSLFIYPQWGKNIKHSWSGSAFSPRLQYTFPSHGKSKVHFTLGWDPEEYCRREGAVGDFTPGLISFSPWGEKETMKWYPNLRVKKTEQYMYGGFQSHRTLSICGLETIESFQALPKYYTPSLHLKHNYRQSHVPVRKILKKGRPRLSFQMISHISFPPLGERLSSFYTRVEPKKADLFNLNQNRTYLSDALLSKNTNMLRIGTRTVLRKNKLPLCYEDDKTQASFIFLYPIFIQNADLPWRNLSFFSFFQYEHHANQSLFFFSGNQSRHVLSLPQPENPVCYQGPFVSKGIGSYYLQYTFPSHPGRRVKYTLPLPNGKKRQSPPENKISRQTSWYPTITYTLLSSSSVETYPNQNTDSHIVNKDFSQALPFLPWEERLSEAIGWNPDNFSYVSPPTGREAKLISHASHDERGRCIISGETQNNSINWFKGLFLDLKKEQEIGTHPVLRQKNNPLWIYENNLLAEESQISRIINLNDKKRKNTKPLISVQPWEKIKKKDDVGKNISSPGETMGWDRIHMDNKKYYEMVGYFTIKESLNSIHKVNYIVESHSVGFQPMPMFEMKQQGTLDSGLTDFQTSQFKREEEKEYIQIDIWTNGSLSPRQALLDAFKKLFELFYNLSKYNCLKPIEI